MSWICHHLHYGDDCYGPAIDELLAGAVAPLVDELETAGVALRFFFVRYPEGGAHLRLRFFVEPETVAEIVARLRSVLAVFERRGAVRVDLRAAEYQPELQRYGGRRGLAISEENFCLSSRLVLRAVAEAAPGARRIGRALPMAIALAWSLYPEVEACAGFLRRYALGSLDQMAGNDEGSDAFRARLLASSSPPVDRVVVELLATLQNGRPSGLSWLDAWREGCEQAAGALRGLAGADFESILGSCLHMHHNRLGLDIAREIHLTHLAAAALAGQLAEAHP